MKIKPLIRAIEVAANVVIVGSAAKSIYDKFKSSNDDDEDEDWDDEDSDSEDLDDETGDDDEGAED
jgi:Na+/H+ antiporter NhaB